MRGEAPKGVPLAGGSKALKGESQTRCAADGPCQVTGGVNRREGGETLRAEGAGGGSPGNSRIPVIGCVR